MANWYVTPRTSMLNTEQVTKLSPLLTPEAAQRALIDPLPHSTPVQFPVAYPEVESTIKPILDGLWVEDADIPAVLKAACDAAKPLL